MVSAFPYLDGLRGENLGHRPRLAELLVQSLAVAPGEGRWVVFSRRDPSVHRYDLQGTIRCAARFRHLPPQGRRWRINLEYLRCDGLSSYRHGNQCLDVDFVQTGSHFRLVRKDTEIVVYSCVG